jgi:membrane protein DedA with SNARE-associated domain
MKKPSDIIKDTRDKVTKPVSSINWLKLLLTMAGLIALSFLLAYLVNLAQDKWNIDVPKYSHLAYIIVFVTSLIANATIIAPVPFAVAIMISSAQNFNPLIISACAAFGGTLGELSGYYAGRLGRKIAIPDSIIGYKKLEGWINKYGPLAIAVIAFQPVIPLIWAD